MQRPQARSRVGLPTAPAARRVSPRPRNRWARRPLRGCSTGGCGCWRWTASAGMWPTVRPMGPPGRRYVTCTGVSDPRCLRRRTLRRRDAFAADGSGSRRRKQAALPSARHMTCANETDSASRWCGRRLGGGRCRARPPRVRSPRSIPARFPEPGAGAGGGMGSISTKDITVPFGPACAPPSGPCAPPPDTRGGSFSNHWTRPLAIDRRPPYGRTNVRHTTVRHTLVLQNQGSS